MQKRQIVDNIVLVQEAIYTRRINKEKGMIIKMDMVSAFNKVCHYFLYAILGKFDFDE
jgi:hypothetical protein